MEPQLPRAKPAPRPKFSLADGPAAAEAYARTGLHRLADRYPTAAAGPVSVEYLDAGIMNYVYRVTAGDRVFYIKQALAGIKKPEGIGADLAGVPPARIQAEARALELLAAGLPPRYRGQVPPAAWFDEANNVLWTEQIGAKSRSLQTELLEQRCRRKTARRVGRLLGAIHSVGLGDNPPLWPTPGEDAANWERFLAMRTLGAIERAELDSPTEQRLNRLYALGRDAAIPGLLSHLDAAPKNVLVSPKGRVALLDFELGASISDPAYDPGFLAGHYLALGVSLPEMWRDARRAAWTLLAGYWEAAPGLTHSRDFAARCLGYAAATMLYRVYGSSPAPYLRPERFAAIRRLALRILTRADRHFG
jgi:hypothetical protein